MIELVPIECDHCGYGAPETGRNADYFALTLGQFNEADIIAYLKRNSIKIKRSGRRFGAEGYGPSI